MSGPEAIVGVVFFVIAGSIVLPFARAFAKRIGGGAAGSKEVESLRDEIAQLGAEVDDLRSRVAPLDEIQNRLDFTERMLAQAKERGQLGAPKEH